MEGMSWSTLDNFQKALPTVKVQSAQQHPSNKEPLFRTLVMQQKGRRTAGFESKVVCVSACGTLGLKQVLN